MYYAFALLTHNSQVKDILEMQIPCMIRLDTVVTFTGISLSFL